MAASRSAFDPQDMRAACQLLSRRDRRLGRVIRHVGEFGLQPEPGGYEVLVRSILSQQISVAAARTIRERLQAQLPGGRIRAEVVAQLTDAQLQQAGISQQKRGYLRDLTRCTLEGIISFRRIAAADDEAAIAELIQVKGIGRWTAQMFLMFSLGRPDIFAPDDLGLRMAMIDLYGLSDKPARSELLDIAAVWAPWRSVASWYLWRARDQGILSGPSST